MLDKDETVGPQINEAVFEEEDVELYCKWKAAGAVIANISSYLGEKQLA